jgi:hypothetical protein
MTLDPDKLETVLAAALRQNFKEGKDEGWDADRAADELAKAIAGAVDGYVRAARVAGVATTVRNAGGVVIGGGVQTAAVALS